jgi:hypothetical protein
MLPTLTSSVCSTVPLPSAFTRMSVAELKQAEQATADATMRRTRVGIK